MLEDADLIVCMAADHREAIVGARPDLATKTFTIKELVRLLEAVARRRAPRRSGGRGRGGAERLGRSRPKTSATRSAIRSTGIGRWRTSSTTCPADSRSRSPEDRA